MKTHQVERNKRAVTLRENGLTYEEIARTLNITRQRAWQIVQRSLSTGSIQGIDNTFSTE